MGKFQRILDCCYRCLFSVKEKSSVGERWPSASAQCMHEVVSDFLPPPDYVALQAPLSMGFPRQEYWSGFCHTLFQGICLTQEWNLVLHCRQTLYCLSPQGNVNFLVFPALSVHFSSSVMSNSLQPHEM